LSNSLIPSFIVDAHQDIAWNALEYGRDPHQSALSSRPVETANGLAALVGERGAGLPEWLDGQVGLIFATLFVMPARREGPHQSTMSYASPQEAEVHARRQLDYYRQISGAPGPFRLVTSLKILDEVLDTWSTQSDPAQRLVGLTPLMEGADPIVEPADLPGWYYKGLRLIGLAWAGTQYAGGTGEPGPLTGLGRQLLKGMAELNMLLDLSHSAEETYLDAVDRYSGVVIASHANPRTFLPTDRGLSDNMIKKLAARDGVMGIVPYLPFLVPGWKTGDPKPGVEKVVEAIDYVAQLTGSARYVAIGTDFDGGFGPGTLPEGMDTIADLQKVVVALQSAGYTAGDVQSILHDNWLRILQKSLPAE
jgi:membrane dipeptidase